MSTNTRVYYQEVEMRTVLENYAKGFRPPDHGALLEWDANYDSHTGKVWFRLTIEMPAPDSNGKNILAMDFKSMMTQVPAPKNVQMYQVGVPPGMAPNEPRKN